MCLSLDMGESNYNVVIGVVCYYVYVVKCVVCIMYVVRRSRLVKT